MINDQPNLQILNDGQSIKAVQSRLTEGTFVMRHGLALLVLTWLQSAAAAQLPYASLEGAARVAYGFANNSDEAG